MHLYTESITINWHVTKIQTDTTHWVEFEKFQQHCQNDKHLYKYQNNTFYSYLSVGNTNKIQQTAYASVLNLPLPELNLSLKKR